MGAPIPKIEAVDNSTAEALLSSLETVAPAERRKHASVFNYWLSIKGDRPFPPIRDLDPLEISDAGPWSVLLELIAGGENAVIRHFGQGIKLGIEAETIARAPEGSLLASIHARLPQVASSMQAMAFEDSFEASGVPARCWVTLLPFSASGKAIDYVYGFVSLETAETQVAAAQPVGEVADTSEEDLEAFQVPLRPLDEAGDEMVAEAPSVELAPEELALDPATEMQPEEAAEPDCDPVNEAPEDPEALHELDSTFDAQPGEADLEPLAPVEQLLAPEPEFVEEVEPEPEAAMEPELEPEPEAEPETAVEPELEPEAQAELASEAEDNEAEAPPKAGFSSKFLESLAHVGGFYGRVVQAPNPSLEECDASEYAEPVSRVEGTLQSKLTDVRAMAEEARQAQIRSNQALYAGLGAAYDFALDAEEQPEEYLRLVEGQGLKIQLRSPMKPVVKLAFAESCDDATIAQLEAVLAWALKNDLPRGSLPERIEEEGGIGSILNGLGKAA